MKRLIFVALFLVVAVSAMGFYSFEDLTQGAKEFVGGFISLTGNAIFPVTEEKVDSFDKIDVPTTKSVEVEKEEPVVEKGEVVEEDNGEVKDDPIVGESINPASTDSSSSSSDSSIGDDMGSYVPACSDFVDNNLNYYKKGICKGKEDGTIKDNYFEDYCSGDGVTLMEYSCGASGSCDGSWYVCANGCGDGACLTEREEPLSPDLKVVSVRNKLTGTSILVRNSGTKGTYFKAKIESSNFETVSDVDYFLEPGKSVEIDVGDKIEGTYSVEIISDELDSNLDDNLVEVDGTTIEQIGSEEEEETEEVNTMITGGYVGASSGEGSAFSKFFDFLRRFF